MKRKATILALALCAALFAGCTKQCLCYDRSGINVYYTEAEVEAAGRTCSDMANQAGKANYYYLCEWEY